MWYLLNTAGMNVVYIAAGVSVVLLLLQIMGKVSLSHPVLVYTGIVFFPFWCVYSLFNAFMHICAVFNSYEYVPGGLLTIFGKYSGSTIIDLLWALFLSSIPYLLFFIGYIKMNLFPYKSVRNCAPAEREATARTACVSLCSYALFTLAIYLSVAVYTLIISFEPIVLGTDMLVMSLPWGIAATLITIIIVPPFGLLLGLVVLGLGAFMFITLLLPLLFVALLLTIAFIITLNAVIRTCRFTKQKVLWLALLSILPAVNIVILIYLLVRLSHKNPNIMQNEYEH